MTFFEAHSLKHKDDPQRQNLAESMAYAAESFIVCTATDVFDVVLGYYKQRRDARRDGKPDPKWTPLFGGEVVGDAVGATTLVLCDQLLSRPMKAVGHALGDAVDSELRWVARHVMHMDLSDPAMKAKYEAWKAYQQDNFVKSAVYTISSVGCNLWAQKHCFGNGQPYSSMLSGKMLGIAATNVVVLGSRLLFPEETKKLDSWVSRNVFAPVIRQTDRLFGVQREEEESRAHDGEGWAARMERKPEPLAASAHAP